MNNTIINNSKIKLCWMVLLFMALSSCTNNFTDINTDKTQFMEITASQYGELFYKAEHEGLDWQTTNNGSRMQSTHASNYCGYTVCGMPDYDKNVMRSSWERRGFEDIYVSALPCLLSIMDIAEEEGNIGVYNLALVWKVFIMQKATDVWGPVPYTEAGRGGESVAYESQKDVYYKMFEELVSAVDALNGLLTNDSDLNIFGGNDRIYGGNVSQWVKFANTLRLRMAIRISNVEPAKAKTEAEAAVANPGGMLENNSDDALFSVVGLTAAGNALPRLEMQRQDAMSSSMESFMKGYMDPRMQEFWSPVEEDPLISDIPDSYRKNIGGYHGFTSGSRDEEYSPYILAFSRYGARFKDGNQYLTPINVINAAETWFLKAEGAWRGWNMGGTAQEFYEKGIEVSIKQWREGEISNDSIQNYINSTSTPIAPDNYPYNDAAASDIPVKFSTNGEVQYEQIMTQKWMALFPISFEAWAEYRRTRLPKIYAKKYSNNANVLPSNGQVVTRIPFIDREYSGNAVAVDAAIEMLGGEDLENVPVWWDINTNGN
nr:SusD/RagB family nutrient-binding outer membrane lipoprotein [uncultured Draconibacterium sp.]